jgi:hypothetical protein
MDKEGSYSGSYFLRRNPEDQSDGDDHPGVPSRHVFPALNLMDQRSLAIFVVAFVIGVGIHQRFFKGRPPVAIIFGTLAVAYIFNLILGITTPPAQIVSLVGHETLASE